MSWSHPPLWTITIQRLTPTFRLEQTGLRSLAHCFPPLPGKAIKLLFSTSPKTVSLRFSSVSGHTGYPTSERQSRSHNEEVTYVKPQEAWVRSAGIAGSTGHPGHLPRRALCHCGSLSHRASLVQVCSPLGCCQLGRACMTVTFLCKAFLTNFEWFFSHVCMLTCIQLFTTLQTAPRQALLSMEFSRQEY